jgi:PAS domain S-box-containing protein
MTARAEASERLSGEIIASLTSGLLVVGDDRHVRSLNPAGRRLLGMPEADWSGDLGDVLLTAPTLARVIEECLDKGQPVRRRTIHIQTRDDRPTHLGVTVSPIGTVPGTPNGAICLFSDLTDIVELEEQLRLRDSLAQVGELTAGIAHEFRNGLATIHGYARLLDLDRLPPDTRPYVIGIRDETDTLGAVVRNFLNFARPADVVLATVETQPIVERAAEEIRWSFCIRRRALRLRLGNRGTSLPTISRKRPIRRVRTRTASQSRVASVGQWILVSTTVLSTRSALPSSNLASTAAATTRSLILSTSAGVNRL